MFFHVLRLNVPEAAFAEYSRFARKRAVHASHRKVCANAFLRMSRKLHIRELNCDKFVKTLGETSLRKIVAPAIANIYLASLYLVLPLMPLLASLLFARWKYVLEYRTTWRKLRIHVAALKEGPAHHYFNDVMGRISSVPQEIHGECVQCGNCCMERRCVFLEPIEGGKYQCGIYHSPFRKLSNCGSFPLNQWDIDRYACPSYAATAVIPIRLVSAASVQS